MAQSWYGVTFFFTCYLDKLSIYGGIYVSVVHFTKNRRYSLWARFSPFNRATERSNWNKRMGKQAIGPVLYSISGIDRKIIVSHTHTKKLNTISNRTARGIAGFLVYIIGAVNIL